MVECVVSVFVNVLLESLSADPLEGGAFSVVSGVISATVDASSVAARLAIAGLAVPGAPSTDLLLFAVIVTNFFACPGYVYVFVDVLSDYVFRVVYCDVLVDKFVLVFRCGFE